MDSHDESCAEESPEVVARTQREREIKGCKTAIAVSLLLARRYRAEGFSGDTRITECLDRVRYYRARIREVNAQIRSLQEAA